MQSQIVKPNQFYQIFAGQTLEWCSTDSKELFEKNCNNLNQRNRLEQFGWLTCAPIIYQFNSEGFRDEEFDSGPAGIALGCSHTQGIGTHVESTWPAQLGQLLNKKIWNLGVGGGALDTCYRMLEYWIQHLEVKFVVCQVPDLSRFEVFDHHWTTILPSETGVEWMESYRKKWIIFEENSKLNQRKNLRAMQQICDQHRVPFFYDLEPFKNCNDNSNARDLLHHGKNYHQLLAKKMHEQIKGKI